MNSEELDKEIDYWLDKAIAEYGIAEIRPGIEARIIAGVNGKFAIRRRRFWWLSMATAATAILVLSSIVYLRRLEDRPAGETAAQKSPQSSLQPFAKQERPASIIQAEYAAKGHARKRAHTSARKTEKNPFLSAEVSGQERYLLLFVKTVSAQSLTGESEAESGPLPMPDFELSTIQIPKVQVSSINIDRVPLPAAHPNEDPL